MDRWIAAERAIWDAVQEVEKLPGDERLTAAVTLLAEAQDKVADYVDAQPQPITAAVSMGPHLWEQGE